MSEAALTPAQRGELQKGDRVALRITLQNGDICWDRSVVIDAYDWVTRDSVVEIEDSPMGFGFVWKRDGYYLDAFGGIAQLYPWNAETERLVNAAYATLALDCGTDKGG